MNMRDALRQQQELQARRTTPESIARRRARYNTIGGAMMSAATRAMEEVGRDSDDERESSQEWQNGQSGTFNL